MRPGCFYMSGQYHGQPDADNCNIVEDAWNHALISFDISGSSSATYPEVSGVFTLSSDCAFSWALNNVSKVNGSIQPSGGSVWSANGISDPKIIIPQGLIDYLGGPDGLTGGYSGMTIASSGNPIGIPSTVEFGGNVRNIQMADVQVFTDVTTDASVTDNLRAFITVTGNPADPALAAALLGKQPEILLTGSDWTAGRNKGTIGNFEADGTIFAYSTPPHLGT